MSEAAGNSPRTLWIILAVSAGILLVPPLVLVLVLIYIENPTSRYATYEDARRAGAVGEGRWIPPFLPESSRNIVETHDIDSNQFEITFDYNPGDLGRLNDECVVMEHHPTLQFYCFDPAMSFSVRLETSGKGFVSSRPDDT